jgi:hypothetical protein
MRISSRPWALRARSITESSSHVNLVYVKGFGAGLGDGNDPQVVSVHGFFWIVVLVAAGPNLFLVALSFTRFGEQMLEIRGVVDPTPVPAPSVKPEDDFVNICRQVPGRRSTPLAPPVTPHAYPFPFLEPITQDVISTYRQRPGHTGCRHNFRLEGWRGGDRRGV